MEETIKKTKDEFEKILNNFLEEINKIRAGRATPALIEDILVDVYGVKTPIKQLASISLQGPKIIIVEPWDKNIIKNLEKTISLSLNATASASETGVRVVLPELSAERREELVKILHDKKEDARIAIRNSREKRWQEIKNKEKEKEISEDEKFRFKKELQKTVDDFNNLIEEKSDKKEEELKTI